MAIFSIRVELHSKNHEHQDYSKLHAAMEKAGFRRTIQSIREKYHLPPAEYLYEDMNLNTNKVLDKVQTIVNSIDRTNGVIVFQIANIIPWAAFEGLKEAR